MGGVFLQPEQRAAGEDEEGNACRTCDSVYESTLCFHWLFIITKTVEK